MTPVIRTIDGFHQDEHGDWVAELSCAHRQHVRHRPPWSEHAWVESEEGRRSRIGSTIECPLCDRAELPDGLRTSRTAGPFDQDTLPAALRRDHLIAERTWGRLRVLEGTIGFSMRTIPPVHRALDAGAVQPIPPGVFHAVEVMGPARLAIDFLVP